IFVKRAIDPVTQKGLEKEAALYTALAEIDYPHIPDFAHYQKDTLILPDLSDWDWSPQWGDAKFNAILHAQAALPRIRLPSTTTHLLRHEYSDVLVGRWGRLTEPTQWDAIRRLGEHLDEDVGILEELTQDDRVAFNTSITVDDFDKGELIHGDIRSDNVAYNPRTNETALVDWDWAEYACASLGRTAFVTAVCFDIAKYGSADTLTIDEYRKYADPLSAIALAGYFLTEAGKPPVKPGSLGHLRRVQQFKRGLIATELYTTLA
ncbi:MAG: hypothetical protein AAB834_02220, partial [Patescibacteria group bacterium]